MKRFLSCFLAALMILTLVLGMASCKKKEENKGEEEAAFSFYKEKMSDYISLNKEDYFGTTIKVEKIPEVGEKDVQDYIDYMLESTVEKTVYTDRAIEEGDTVSLYFRGSVDGVDFEGGSNMEDKAPASLVIGSGNFIPGFEDALIGLVPNSTSFTRVESGTIKADYVAYGEYAYTSGDKTGEVKVRIDLANPGEKDKVLADNIIGKTVGTSFNFEAEYDVDGDGTKENAEFTMKVNFASIEETAPITVTFPDPYKLNEEMSGKEAVFHVVVKELSRAELPELTAELITDTLKYKSDKDAKGDELVKEFRESVELYLNESRDSTIKNAALNKLFTALYEKAEVKKYPEKVVEDLLKYSNDDLKGAFDYYTQNYTDFPYTTVEEFAPDYYGANYDSTLSHEEAMDKYVRKTVLMQMVPFYIIQAENIDFESEEAKQESINSMAEYYANYYSNMYGQTYTAAGIIEMMGEEALIEEALVNLLYEKILEENTIEELVKAETEAE
ncbi:MAG: hypothetical protein E7587_08275 [Ruminococcaceae bacterium]|nr:hypothetical protein [Oscillospiraceae bacterium]